MSIETPPRLGPVAQYALLAGPLLSMLDSSIVNVAVEPISRELGAPLTTVQWAVSGYLLALGTGLALTSYLARRWGTLAVYRAGILAFTAASALCALAPTVDLLIAARFAQGLAGATLVPLAMSMLMGGDGAARRISPIAGMLLFLGPALGPSLGGILIGAFGWRSIFFINLPVGVVAAFAIRRIPAGTAPGRDTDRRLDVPGLAMLSGGLFGLLYGANQGESEGWVSAGTWIPLTVGGLLIAAYVAWSRRVAFPVLDLSILTERGVSLSFLLCAMASVTAWSIVFLLPVFLQSVQGYSPLAAGLTLLPQGVLTGLGTVLGQRIADRIGVRVTVLGGFVVLTASSLGLLVIGAHTPLPVTATILAGRAASIGLVITPLLTVLNAPLRPEQRADANTAFNVCQRIAGSFGIGLIANLFAARSVAEGPVDALHLVAVLMTALASAAVPVSLLLPGRRDPSLEPAATYHE
jgi:EmrB/QacA subfamily drug resistance transporter